MKKLVARGAIAAVKFSAPFTMDNNISINISISNDGDPSTALPVVLQVLFGSVLSLFDITVVLGNILVISTLCGFKEMRSPTYAIVCSLAAADLIIGVFVIPFAATEEILRRWVFPSGYCYWRTAIDVCSSTSSILHILVVSMERYIAVVHPFWYRPLVRASTVAATLLVTWILACGNGAIILFSDVWKDPTYQDLFDDPNQCFIAFNNLYLQVTSTFVFFVPAFVVVMTNVKIWKEAQRHVRQISAIQSTAEEKTKILRDRKASKIITIVVAAFIGCWLPFFALANVNLYCHCIPDSLYLASIWLGYVNSALNVLIYSVLLKKFRKVFKIILFWRQANNEWVV